MAKKKLLDLEGLQYYHRKLKAVIGELSALTTTDKDNLVVAINEAEADAIEAGRMATSAQTTANEALAKAEASGHTHSNKALLDTYTQTEADLADAVAKKHAHSNATVLDGITAEKVAGWDQAVTDDHTHSNKAILDATTASYTTEEKTKLAGIAEGAQVNKIETVKVNGTALTPDASKAVDVTVPTKLTDLTNDGNFVQDASYVHTDNNYTSAEKTKLAGIAEGAQVNVLEGVQVNGADLTIDENKKVNVVIPAATVTGVKSGENIISLDGTELKSTLSVAIDKPTSGANSGKTMIQLLGISDAVVAEVDASEFVVDGMLDSVTYDSDAHTMTFTWNTDAGKQATTIDLDDVIAPYTAGNGIDITNNQVSVKLDPTQGNVTLSTTSAGLKAEVELSGYTTHDEFATHTGDTTAHITAAERTKWNSGYTVVENNIANWNDAFAKEHEHSNKALLDTYTQTEANLADAVAKKHEHTNKSVLDGIDSTKVAAWDAKVASVDGGTYIATGGTATAPSLDLKADMIETSGSTANQKLASKDYVDGKIAGIAAPSNATISFVDNEDNALGSFTLNQASNATIDIFDSISNGEIDALFA